MKRIVMHINSWIGRATITAFAAVVLIGFATGCSQKPCSVSGRVTYQGRPVSSGSIVFYCANDQIVRGVIDTDGAYTIPNVPRGMVRVTVKAHSRAPEGFRKRLATPPMINGPVTPDTQQFGKEQVRPIPARYGVPGESGLLFKAERATTEFDIDLVP
jgi:hypothetical protein